MVAFETPARQGMVVNEDLILEIVRPGTGDPVVEGDVGEIVVTSLDPHHPWIRLAIGDLTAALPGASPCGRTNMRIRGWMGRADQTTKVKGMFVRPEQIAEIGKRHPELARLRLVVTRVGETDVMTLSCECTSTGQALRDEVTSTLRAVTKLGGAVELLTPGSLPNDGLEGGGRLADMTKKKAKRTAEKPKYVPTVAERAAIETTLARLKSTTTPWLKIENGQLRHDHPDEVVGSILLQNAFASADVSFCQRTLGATSARKSCFGSGGS